jgi:hypothetical protein
MGGQAMDRAAAGRFVEAWCANWRKVDIDAVVSHFAENAEMRSPLALKLTESPVVAGAANIRAYWREGVWPHRERRPENPELELGRHDRAPDGVVAARRSPRQRVHGLRWCRPCGAQRSLLRKIAMRFPDIILLLNTLWFGGAFIQFSIAQGNTLKILVPREGARQSDRADPVGQRGLSRRDQSPDRPAVVLSVGGATDFLPGD